LKSIYINKIIVKSYFWLGVVLHTCSPSYLGGGDYEDHGLSPTQAKRYHDPISSIHLGMVACTCGSSHVRVRGTRITVQAIQGKNTKPLTLKNN
jgi:hypothetical protein